MDPSAKREAQQRVDRIGVFRRELAGLAHEGVLSLTPEQRQKLDQHHEAVIADLGRRFDIDATESQKRVSWAMRIASLLGALALCAALALFFQRIWGYLPTPAHVTLLVATPLLLLAATEYAARRAKTLYYAGLLSLVAIAAFVTDLSILGTIFNMPGSPNALLVWGAFAMILAYVHGLRLPLAAGLLCLMGGAACWIASWSGVYWANFASRPETALPGAVLVAGLPLLIRRPAHADFSATYRLLGLLVLYIALLIRGNASFLPLEDKNIDPFHHFVGLLACALITWLGIRHGQVALVNLSAAFFAIFLYVRLFAWWWDWMPKYLFCLLIGLIALGLLAVFRRLRGRLLEARQP